MQRKLETWFFYLYIEVEIMKPIYKATKIKRRTNRQYHLIDFMIIHVRTDHSIKLINSFEISCANYYIARTVFFLFSIDLIFRDNFSHQNLHYYLRY